MLYLLGRIDLFSQVVAKFFDLLEAIDRAVARHGALAVPEGDVQDVARHCCFHVGSGTTLSSLHAQLLDAIIDLAHQLESLEKDICYERKRLLETEMAELCSRYWSVRYALQQLMDVSTSRYGVKMPKLAPDPFSAELNLGLF